MCEDNIQVVQIAQVLNMLLLMRDDVDYTKRVIEEKALYHERVSIGTSMCVVRLPIEAKGKTVVVKYDNEVTESLPS